MTIQGYKRALVVGLFFSFLASNGSVDGFHHGGMPALAPSILPGSAAMRPAAFSLRASPISTNGLSMEEENDERQQHWDLTFLPLEDSSEEEEEFSTDKEASRQPAVPSSPSINPNENTNTNTNNHNEDWYKQPEFQKKRQQRREYLERVTRSLLETEPGSLQKGKWHELSSMLQAWSGFSKTDAQAPVMMERILKRLNEERAAGNTEAVADMDMYNRLLDAWACAALFNTQGSRTPQVASQRARAILVTLQETYELSSSSQKEGEEWAIRPNQESFNVVLHAVCRTEGPTIARRLLALMEYLHRSGKNPLAKPSRQDYILVLSAYANDRRITNAGALAEGFLRHMKITGGITPDTFCYNLAIKAWTQSKRGRESAEHANRILEEMEAPKDIVTYASVISAWATSGMRAHAVERAEGLLRQIENHPELEPNTVVLNAVMSTWVKSRSPGACKRIEELLQEMEQSSETSIRPDLIAYNTYLHALSIQSKKPIFAQRADDVLQKMEERYERRECDFAPNLFSYNLLIEAWAKSPDPEAAMRAARVLRQLAKVQRPGVEPDTFSFNQVLSALSRNSMPGAAKMAEELLWYMDKAYRTGVHPNAKPDAIGFTSVIQAYARSGETGAAAKAEQLLRHMKERYYVHNETEVKPNRKVYNSVIHCWARSGEGTLGARKAEALMQEMQGLREKYSDVSMSPNLVTFNSVLNAWALSGTRCCGYKAESYLDQMWELYNAGDNDLVKPNDLSYNTVINAISKGKNEAKAQRALRILRRMDKLYQAGVNKQARPNEVTYTAVLNSCAFPAALDARTRRKALDTAIFTLEELKASRYGQPNHITYGTFLKACANLLPDDDKLRRAVITEAFQQCCRDGQVGDMVLSHLRSAAPADLYQDLVVKAVRSTSSQRKVSNRITMEDLPPEWSANVRTNDSWRARSARVRKPDTYRRK